jgi:hypothetical protein
MGAAKIRGSIHQAVRPGRDATGRALNMRGDRLDITAATVGDIPDWLNGFQLYHVVAKADQPVPQPEQVRSDGASGRALSTAMAYRDARYASLHHRGPQVAGSDEARNSRQEVFATHDKRRRRVHRSVHEFTNQLPVAGVDGVRRRPDEARRRLRLTLAVSEVERHPGEKGGNWTREAVEEAGFRVEARKIPLEVTVVDRCERPGEY